MVVVVGVAVQKTSYALLHRAVYYFGHEKQQE